MGPVERARLRSVWAAMRHRCRVGLGVYGKRGITVCARWEEFENFLADMGARPSPKHSLDRIDNNGNYEPSNCRWATRQEQGRNMSTNTFLTHNGETLTLVEWCERIDIRPSVICMRIHKLKWSIDRALSEPLRPKLPERQFWRLVGMSKTSWYRAGRPGLPKPQRS